MFKPNKMSEAHLFVLNKDVKRVSELLYDLRVIQFFNIEKEAFSKYEHEDLNDQSHTLLELRSIINFLEKYHKEDTETYVEDPIAKAKKLMQTLEKTQKEIFKLEDDIKRRKVVDALRITEKELKAKSYTIGYVQADKKNYLKALRVKGIEHRKYNGESRSYFIAKATAKSIPFPFNEFYLPTKTLNENPSSRLIVKREKVKEIEEKVTQLSNATLRLLQDQEFKLDKELGTAEAKKEFMRTGNVSVLSGYLPTHKVTYLRRKLESELGHKFELDTKEIIDKDAPIELNNGSVSKDFEALLEMYSLPSYKEFDPTKLMFFVFPLFFGFVLGDVIYGLISLLFFTALKFKLKNLKEFMTILQLSAVSSMIFGVIYGEFMGFEFHSAFYGFFVRSHEPQMLLLIAILFGLVHINMGVLIGFWNSRHHIKHAIFDHLSWIVLQLGAAGLAVGYMMGVSLAVWIGWFLLAASVIMIYLGHGFIGIIEIPSFFTNILSYARLMAVGLSSIAIAVLINEFSVPLFSSGALGIIAGIFLFSLGHVFNIALGNFESFLHTLRLHYVEFFTKFYQGGGQKFVPFGRREDLNS